MTAAPSQLGLFARSGPDRERADLQFHIQPLSLDKFGEPLHPFPGITSSVGNLQPTSRGWARVLSVDPQAAPEIAPNYLSTDWDRMVAALYPAFAQERAGTGPGALQPGGVPAGPDHPRRRRGAGEGSR